MSESELMELQKLREENAKLKQAQAAKLKISVSNKGAVMVTGMRRFPVTFYPEEWTTLFSMQDSIKNFCKDNAKEIQKRQENPVEPQKKAQVSRYAG